MDASDLNGDLFAGLRALAESAFPKRCPTCSRLFRTAEEFLQETQGIRTGVSGLKQSVDDDDVPIVEIYRNCLCGSTLMDFFSDRRDMSQEGLQRRKKFEELLSYVTHKYGLERQLARKELIKVLRGQTSEVLQALPGGAGNLAQE